jgi:DNA polymerase III alpha subunit (gram-positive type)
MTIRVEVQIHYVCEECGYSWVPCKVIGGRDVVDVLSEECPQCQEAKREAGRMIRHFDPVVELLG